MRRFFLFVLLPLAMAYLLTGVVQVRPGERAVVRRFGRVLDDKPSPGLWVGLPWGMDRVDRVPVQLVRTVTVGFDPDRNEDSVMPPGQLLTGDNNLVNIRAIMDYTVDEDRVVDFVLHADRADDLVARAAEAALASWAAGQSVDDVLLARKSELLSVLRRQTQATLAGYQLGITIQDAAIVLIAPPDEVKSAFDEVTRAQAEIRTRENDARQAGERMLREAEAQRYKVEQLTAAYRTQQVRVAHADADRFQRRMEEYHRLRDDNPAYLQGVWWDEMSSLFAKLKAEGRVDLLDKQLAGSGQDITVMPPLPGKK